MTEYDGMTIAEIIDDFGRVRGDLSEQYARDYLSKIIEQRLARMRTVAHEAGWAACLAYQEYGRSVGMLDTMTDPYRKEGRG